MGDYMFFIFFPHAAKKIFFSGNPAIRQSSAIWGTLRLTSRQSLPLFCPSCCGGSLRALLR